jgi:cysteine rich repeat protein
MKRLLLFCLTCALVIVMASGAFTQVEKPCAGDVAKFCPEVQSGGGRIAQCLKQNKEQLSPGCKMHLLKVEELMKEVDQACEDDVTKFCSEVQPGGGRIAQCLKQNKKQLSFECKVKLFKAKREME